MKNLILAMLAFSMLGRTVTYGQCTPPSPTITGATMVCASHINTYSTDPNQTNYVWSVSTGTIISGNGTNAIQVQWQYGNGNFGGSVSVTYTDINGCNGSNYLLFTGQGNLNASISSNPSNPLVCEGTSVTYTTESGKSNYLWSISQGIIENGQGTNSVSVLWNTSGNQSVTIEYNQANGCFQTITNNLNIIARPVPTISGPDTTCEGETVEYITEPNKSNYTWNTPGGSWVENNGDTLLVRWMTSGTKTISINYSEGTSCFANTPTVKNISISAPSITGQGNTCPGSQLIYSTESGMSDYSWIVTGGTVINGNGTNQIIVNWPSIGSFGLRVDYTNQNGCRSGKFMPVSVTSPEVPGPIQGTSTSCVGSASFNYTLETGKTNYSWSTSSGGTILSGQGQTFVVIAWDTPGMKTIGLNYAGANGCMASTPTTKTITVVDVPEPTIGGSFSTCEGSTQSYFTQSGMFNYNWSVSSGGNINSGQGTNTIDVQWINSGVHQIDLEYLNINSNCSLTQSASFIVNVNQLPIPTISISGPSTFCQGGSATLTASLGSSYYWSTSETSQSITVTNNGNYYVTVTDANGCSATSPVIPITVNTLPSAIITPGGATTFCSGGSVTLTANTGSSYLWPNGATTQSITTSSSGNYSVSVTDTNGCSATSAATLVTVNANPTITITGSVNGCGSTTLYANGGNSYAWSGVASGSASSATVSSTGWVYVTGTNSNGCSAVSSIYVTINANPAISISGPTSACYSTTISASGGTSYSWSGPGISGGGSSKIIYYTGWYYVTGYNSAGCSSTASKYITINPNPSISISGPSSACNSTTLSANGGSSYSWSGPGVSGAGSSKTAYYTGWYYVTGYSAAGCSSSANIYVTINSTPTVYISKSGNYCPSGYVTLTAYATAGSTYYWYHNGATSASTWATGGNKTVLVTKNGCSASASYYVAYQNCSGGGGGGGGMLRKRADEPVADLPIQEPIQSGIFPNPVNNELNVILEEPVKFYAELSLTELSGKILENRTIEVGGYKTTFQTEHIPDGIYILAILSDSRKKYMKVMVKHQK